MDSLSFRPINLALDWQTAVLFRQDAFACSFGTTPSLEVFDPEKYLNWLRAKLAEDPKSAVHVWQRDRVIGQMELGADASPSLMGYINLYYLIPEVRGTGISQELDQYALEYFRSLGVAGARLSVSPSNQRAIRYYERNGWKHLGVREDAPELSLMEKVF